MGKCKMPILSGGGLDILNSTEIEAYAESSPIPPGAFVELRDTAVIDFSNTNPSYMVGLISLGNNMYIRFEKYNAILFKSMSFVDYEEVQVLNNYTGSSSRPSYRTDAFRINETTILVLFSYTTSISDASSGSATGYYLVLSYDGSSISITKSATAIPNLATSVASMRVCLLDESHLGIFAYTYSYSSYGVSTGVAVFYVYTFSNNTLTKLCSASKDLPFIDYRNEAKFIDYCPALVKVSSNSFLVTYGTILLSSSDYYSPIYTFLVTYSGSTISYKESDILQNSITAISAHYSSSGSYKDLIYLGNNTALLLVAIHTGKKSSAPTYNYCISIDLSSGTPVYKKYKVLRSYSYSYNFITGNIFSNKIIVLDGYSKTYGIYNITDNFIGDLIASGTLSITLTNSEYHSTLFICKEAGDNIDLLFVEGNMEAFLSQPRARVKGAELVSGVTKSKCTANSKGKVAKWSPDIDLSSYGISASLTARIQDDSIDYIKQEVTNV